jgi:hypothetical protein
MEDLSTLKQDMAVFLQNVKGAANGLYDSAAAGSGRAAQALTQHIEEQPLVALLLAFGLGYVGARLLQR